MEVKQQIVNEGFAENTLRSQTNSSNSKLFVVAIISVLLTAAVVGSTIYFLLRSVNKKTVANQEQKITSLEKQISTMKKAIVSLQPNSNNSLSALTPSISPLPSPIPTTDPTATWKIYKIVGPIDQDLNITYKLPTNVISEPSWANAGRYYKDTILPGNTHLAIIPIGKKMSYQYTWDELINKVVVKYNYPQKTTKFANLSTAIRFSGRISSFEQSADLLILGEGEREFQGIIVKVNSDLSLYILLYQDAFNKERKDFFSDKVLFNQILSTFKFTK